MDLAVKTTVRATRGAVEPWAICSSAKARNTTRTCCKPPPSNCFSFFFSRDDNWICKARRDMPASIDHNISKGKCFIKPFQAVKDLGLSVTGAAQGLGVSRKTLSSILNGRAGISPEMAVRLSIAFDTTAESRLKQQVHLADVSPEAAPYARSPAHCTRYPRPLMHAVKISTQPWLELAWAEACD